VASGMWVGSHGPVGGGLSLRQSNGPLEHGPDYLKGVGLAEWRTCVPVDCWLGGSLGCGPGGGCACIWIACMAGRGHSWCRS
jgi:hypothetical protein